MKRSLFTCTILSLLSASFSAAEIKAPFPTSNFLWYKQAATDWNKDQLQTLPIGNGRIGAMISGDAQQEKLFLNEVSLWSGGKNIKGGYSYGPKAKENEFGCYLPFGTFDANFTGKGEVSDYIRSLNLDTATATVSYTQDGVKFKREYITSFPHQVIAIHCTADKPGAISGTFSMQMDEKLNPQLSYSGNTITLSGTLDNNLSYEGKVLISTKNGTVKAESDNISVSNADSCTIYILLATDYEMDYKKNFRGESPEKRNLATLKKLKGLSYAKLKEEHVANYQSLYGRVKLNLGKTDSSVSSLPTDERLKAYKQNQNDPELEETLFQYGRYCLISSSRPGSLPANLQGIWNDNVHPAWACDYHSNINIQMCYWLAEPTNLGECAEPLINFLEATAPVAAEAVAEDKRQFPTTPRGWTVRTSQNPFGGQGWNWNIPGAAWYARHIWEHYTFSGDKKYLKEVGYPMMKEISQFWEDNLKTLGKDGEGFESSDKKANLEELKGIKAGSLVAPKGWSPEHGPNPEDGVAHDQQLIWDLFNNTIIASRILGVDKAWAKELAAKRDKLIGPKISPNGYLQEWMIDRPNNVRGHRHTSHLFAVYPGLQISKEKTPELAEAAMKSLELRGNDGDCRRSWTWPWRTALWARFKQGDRAHEMIENLLKYNTMPNLLATHTPFQMDGSFGISAGISEMLLQSHAGIISLLPAPTKAWPKGSVKGLRAYGNVIVNYSWENGKVTNYKLFSTTPRTVTINVNGKNEKVTTQAFSTKGSPKDASPKKGKKKGKNISKIEA